VEEEANGKKNRERKRKKRNVLVLLPACAEEREGRGKGNWAELPPVGNKKKGGVRIRNRGEG
jgi:hypothetical protein